MIPDFKCYVLDLDGVVYRGTEAVPGAAEAVRYLQEKARVVILTNNATLHRQDYVKKLRGFGLAFHEKDIITSGYTAAMYLKERSPGCRVYVVGEDGLKKEMEEAGMTVAEDDCDVVVAALDRTLTYRKMTGALRCLLEGASFVATNLDRTLITETDVLPGGGSIVKAIEYASGMEPVVTGKPTAIMAGVLMDVVREESSDILMIGDRLSTDIAMGKIAGTKTLLVLTGDDTEEDVRHSDIKPDFIENSLADLKLQEGLS